MAPHRTSTASDRLLFGAAFVTFMLGGGCGDGTVLQTATEPPKSPRRPDGVALEPPPALPVAVERAPASGVVALREPLADKDVEEVVRAYLRAFVREDVAALDQLLTHDATQLGRPGGRAQLLALFRTRIQGFEYQKLAGAELARFSQLERRTFDSFAAPGGGPARPVEMRAGDIYVRVPILIPRVGTEQLFGDFLVLLLRREDARLKIAGQADENGS